VTHPNEDRLRDLYATFAKGDIPQFLDGCTDDVTFVVPGEAAVSGTFTKATFMDLLAPVMERSGGTFQEEVLDVFANDDHGLVLLHHTFDRDGEPREYRTAHIVELRDGQISAWAEHPGSLREFEQAWGPR
jgi:ketosteroid isomerase-like protein